MKNQNFNLRKCRSAVLALVVLAGAAGCRTSRDDHAPEAAAAAQSVGQAARHKALTGAELYAINCNRCHPERYPVEWNTGEWQTLLTHMRVRANLPAGQANTILEYLQANGGN